MGEYIIGVTPTGLDHTLLALADPTRRKILERLSRGETRVTDLAKPFPISLNSVSKHVRILERARLVRRRRIGREHLLSLDPRPLDQAGAWIDQQRSAWAKRLDKLEALLESEDEAAGAAAAATAAAAAAAAAAATATAGWAAARKGRAR